MKVLYSVCLNDASDAQEGLLKVIPEIIHKIHSRAEAKIFSLLKDCSFEPSWQVFHSLNVSEHQYKQWSELDFVLLGPAGIFVLEVKGGRVACEDGIWIFTDRYGIDHKKSEGPFKQSETGLYALQRRLIENFSEHEIMSFVMGWGVVFPDILFETESPEMPRSVVCDMKFCRNPELIRAFIEQLINYWTNKRVNRNRGQLGPALRKAIASYLRPNFDHVPSLVNRVNDLYQQAVRLTDEQYRFLDAVEETDRIICTGGAGTGKSFLAIETARRELASGRNVILTARGEIFPEFLRRQLNNDRVNVVSAEKLEKMRKSGNLQSCDVLIVDEGQDVMNLEFLDTFDRTLKGGLEQGRWRWFMDQNNQSGIYNACDSDAEAILISTGSLVLRLKRNCRNTEQIISSTETVTGADIGITEIKGKGPPVHYSRAQHGTETANKLAEVIESWLDSSAFPGDIAVLSTVGFEESSACKLPSQLLKTIEVLSENNVANIPRNRITFSTVKNFKGLEKQYIALIDMGKQDDTDNDVAMLYVAMTRSHACLWISVCPEFEKKLRKLQEKNARLILRKEREKESA